MKKFFALMLVVAMLSVAGSAMAVTIAVSGDKTVSVQAGKSAGFTLVVSLDHSDVLESLSVDISSGTAGNWATSITSSEVTFSVPSTTTAGTYAAVIRARENYISSDTTGHSILTDTATVRVSLDVTAASLPPNTEVVTETAKVVDVDKSTAVTVEETKASATEKGQAEQKKALVITNLNATPVETEFAASAVPSDAVVKDGSNMTVASTANYDVAGTDAAKLANLRKAAAMLKHLSGNNEERAIGVVQPFTAREAGLQPLSLPALDSVYYGRNIGMYMGGHEKGGNEVVFLNSRGDIVSTVPSGDVSGVTAGKLLAVTYVEPSKTYTPILWTRVTASEEASFDAATGTTTVSNIDIVVPTNATSKDETEFNGKNFTIHVGSADRRALERATNLSLDLIPASTVSSDTTRSGDLYIGTTYVEEVALIPRLQNLPASAAGHGYVAAFKYDKLVNSRTITSSPLFVPDWSNGNAAGDVYAITGTTTKTARVAVSGDVYTGNTGYLVFRVSGDTIAFSTSAASFADPRLVAASSPTTPSTDYPEGTSSSSGGCSAGSAALALAVLGSFILTRKK